MPHLLQEAFEGRNRRIPVWFMRQAGRYLPAYQRLRRMHGLEELFLVPELAAEVTCLPLEVLDVDALILFADILTLPWAMGIPIRYPEEGGPRAVDPIRGPEDVRRLREIDDVPHVRWTLRLVRRRVGGKVPLIGFAGAPWTVLGYLLERGDGEAPVDAAMAFARRHPEAFVQAVEVLTRNTVRYLRLQEEEGAAAFQLFDTWAGRLTVEEYRSWAEPSAREILRAARGPTMYYARGAGHLLGRIVGLPVEVISVCEEVAVDDARLASSGKGVQGNLAPETVLAPEEVLERELEDLLERAGSCRRYIFNLGHGVLPETDPARLQGIIRRVHGVHWG